MSGARKPRGNPWKTGSPPRGARAPAWRRAVCSACGRPVIVAGEDTGGGRLEKILIETAPVPYGNLVRTLDGALIRDAGILPGTRYAQHYCPARNS